MLVLTSSLHYVTIIPILFKNKLVLFDLIYIYTILLSTTFSILWHNYYESNVLRLINYFLIGIWFILDAMWCILLNNKLIIYINFGIFILNNLVYFTDNYILYHSIWHILSVIKCVYVSFLIKNEK